MQVSELAPKEIWKNFVKLNEVPRPSKKEERVIEFMVNFGKQLGLETHTDRVGNIIIKKPATQGMENRPTVILQSHVDMVHQKNNDTVFDFDKQGIEMYVDGDWVKAKGTTLGADNGIGVATIMGILASEDISHPAIEGMFTVDEETGMTGAKELDPSFYDGKILLNLDTEDDDELSIGCAGGIDTNTTFNYKEENANEEFKGVEINLKGLMGGHSGMDIHRGRGNANKLMNRLLFDCPVPFDLHQIEGGGLRNAIPRESVAIISVAENDLEKIEVYIKETEKLFLNEFNPVEKNLVIQSSRVEVPAKKVGDEDKKQILRTIYALHNGVFKWSLTFDDLVETSSSLAQVIIKNGVFETKSLQRSSVESTKTDVANSIKASFEMLGADVVQDGDYPGWEPNPDSPILKLTRELYKEIYGEEPKVLAGHAGLECGILGKHLPDVDMISFGPNIRRAHSPDECVQISSVQKFWDFFLAVLKKV
jgi:dipeptidase D